MASEASGVEGTVQALTKARVTIEIRIEVGRAVRSAARQAFSVAPVVKVSSTRRMWRGHLVNRLSVNRIRELLLEFVPG